MMMNWNDGGGHHMDGLWGWIGGAMMIGWMVLMVVGIVALVVWLARTRSGETAPAPRLRSARDVIDARYASGEIDESQRSKMLETIA